MAGKNTSAISVDIDLNSQVTVDILNYYLDGNVGVIYEIHNIMNNKKYIGQTINYKSRKKRHLEMLTRNKHVNINLQNDWNLYGSTNFIIRPIKFCKIEELNIIETQYIISAKTYEFEIGYNQTLGTFSSKKNNACLEKFKKKMVGKTPWNKGKKTGIIPWNKGKTYKNSNYTRPETQKPPYKVVIGINLETNEMREFSSLTEAGLFLGSKPSKITQVCRGNRKHHKNWKFSYKENEVIRG